MSAKLHCFACSHPVLPPSFVEQTALYPLNGFGSLAEDHSSIYAIHRWSVYMIPLDDMCKAVKSNS